MPYFVSQDSYEFGREIRVGVKFCAKRRIELPNPAPVWCGTQDYRVNTIAPLIQPLPIHLLALQASLYFDFQMCSITCSQLLQHLQPVILGAW